jgi:hypothetical protein
LSKFPHLLAQSVGQGASGGLGEGAKGRPTFFLFAMLEIDESDFTQDHYDFLQEWADALGITVKVLLARIVLACSEGDQYIQDAPYLRPTPRE